MKTLRLSLLFLMIFEISHAQENPVNRSSFFTAGVLQIKESANFGLVFTGPAVNYGLNREFLKDNRLITYENKFGLGILFSRGIPSLAFYLKPVDLGYLFKVYSGTGNLYIGPSLKLVYDYELYPDLQAGFDYWFTDLSLGLNALYNFSCNNSIFRITVNSSFAGFVSRQPEYRDPYYYDLGFKYAVKHLHQDMEFGSFSRYHSTDLEILWKHKKDSRLALGYVLEYSGYFKAPDFVIINQSIKLVIKKKQK